MYTCEQCPLIQIHLMLIFISHRSGRSQSFKHIQIHLMLIFIDCMCRGNMDHMQIQIHLMLIFIGRDDPHRYKF